MNAKTKVFILSCAICAVCVAVALAANPGGWGGNGEEKFQSPEANKAVADFSASLQKIEEGYQDKLASLRKERSKSILANREELAKVLETVRKAAMKADNLAEAVKLNAAAKKLLATEAVELDPAAKKVLAIEAPDQAVVIFCGLRGHAYDVVFVIDRSGSMIDTFDPVRNEMLRTINRLRETQMFHIILFAEGQPLEPDHKRLVPATRRNKKAASRFLSDITAEGQTNPIPALQQAFKVLKGARKKGKLIYLLTDGVFPDNGAVLKTIARENKDKKVHINTFLYGTAPPKAVSVMTKIAKENGGQYKFVEHED